MSTDAVPDSEIQLDLSRDEALVFFEWLSRFNKDEDSKFADQAEQRRSVSATTRNFIRWFDENAPTVRFSFASDQVDAVTVVNPYDTATDGAVGKCVIRTAGANEKP